MKRTLSSRLIVLSCLIGLMLNQGCVCLKRDNCSVEESCGPTPCVSVDQLEIDDPWVTPCTESQVHEQSPELVDPENATFTNLTLEEAIQLALQNSEVMRDLGGTVLRSPTAVQTTSDPAIAYTDPQFGEEAALSAFDASFAARAFFDKNDRVFNNQFLGANGLLQQDLGNYQLELAKRSATGTQMSLRHVTDYDYNNSVGNRFGSPSSSWTTFMDAEVRQPLLQGAGIAFNRIAGPGNLPGVNNGVLIARIRTDQSLADFEIGIRDLVSNVENAYWDLYFAYRDFDAKVEARDLALSSLQQVKNRMDAGDAKQDELSQVEEQYWRFKSEAQEALGGRLVESTRTFNGSGGGTFRGAGGVRVAERRLRLMMGIAINDGTLMRPADEPTTAPVRFDWDMISEETVSQRPEIRKQRWTVKQRELELLANRNHLLPQLDAVGRYRVRGMGQSLIADDNFNFDSASEEFFNGDFQEWQLGVEFSAPLGFRQGHAAVRNGELRLAREKAILREQKRQVLYGVSNAMGDIERSFDVLQSQYYRRKAALSQVTFVRAAFDSGKTPIDVLLEAQRRLLDAQIRYFQARTDYVLALKNMHYEKGTLLDYASVSLAESRSSRGAKIDAATLMSKRGKLIDYVTRDISVSRCRTPQNTLPHGDMEVTTAAATHSAGVDGGSNVPDAAIEGSRPVVPREPVETGQAIEYETLRSVQTEQRALPVPTSPGPFDRPIIQQVGFEASVPPQPAAFAPASVPAELPRYGYQALPAVPVDGALN